MVLLQFEKRGQAWDSPVVWAVATVLFFCRGWHGFESRMHERYLRVYRRVDGGLEIGERVSEMEKVD